MVTEKDLDKLAADRRVAAILAAAKGDADPGELAGEREAVAGFLAVRAATPAVESWSGPPARAVGTHAPGGRFRGRFRFAVIAGAAVLAAGGVAVAAPAGGIPGLGHHHSAEPSRGPNSGIVTSSPLTGPHAPPATGGPATGLPTTGAPSTAGPTAAQLMHGRCQSWKAMVDSGKTVDFGKSPYDKLAAAAGGPERVPAFCAAILGTPQGHGGTRHPSAPPDGHATAPPDGHPTAPPDGHPSGAPGRTKSHPAQGNH